MKDLENYKIISEQIKLLEETRYTLQQKIKDNFIASQTEVFILPSEVTLNWRELSYSICIDYKTQQYIFELRDVESPRFLNGKDSKAYPQGSKFLVLKKWKTGKTTKGTHYLLFDKKSKRIANYYG